MNLKVGLHGQAVRLILIQFGECLEIIGGGVIYGGTIIGNTMDCFLNFPCHGLMMKRVILWSELPDGF